MCKRTNLKPHLLVQRGNLLSSAHGRTLLALRLQRHVTINLRMSSKMAMVRCDAARGRWLGMSHSEGETLDESQRIRVP